MVLTKWEWTRKNKQKAPVYYDSDEDLFFDRLNHYNLMRFWDALEFVRYEMAHQELFQIYRQRWLMRQPYYAMFRIIPPPPAYPAPTYILDV